MNFLPETNFLTMISNATLVVQCVMGILGLMSVWSWSLIFFKLVQINAAKNQIKGGMLEFLESRDLHQGLQTLARKPRSPLFIIGHKAMDELKHIEQTKMDLARKKALVADTLRRVLRRGVTSEMKRLSGSLAFLATCANAAPFIGLFGTVWGIMNSFHSIGMAKSAALATVAPGISEALVATAIGLAVAIPATIAYNFFLGMLNSVQAELINFAGAFLNRMEWETAKLQKKAADPDKSKEPGKGAKASKE